MIIIRRRKPNRLKKYNYSSSGWYFVTICTQNREYLFGNIFNNKMVLNQKGLLINDNWKQLINKFPIELDEFVIMPNHIHGIIVIRNSNQSVGNDHRVVPNNNKHDVPINNNQVGHDGPTLQNIRQQQLLFRIIQWFKTITTNIYIKGVKNNQFPRFDKRIWQKSFYDHIIRNEYSLFRIRKYIRDNPMNWEDDRNNIK